MYNEILGNITVNQSVCFLIPKRVLYRKSSAESIIARIRQYNDNKILRLSGGSFYFCLHMSQPGNNHLLPFRVSEANDLRDDRSPSTIHPHIQKMMPEPIMFRNQIIFCFISRRFFLFRPGGISYEGNISLRRNMLSLRLNALNFLFNDFTECSPIDFFFLLFGICGSN